MAPTLGAGPRGYLDWQRVVSWDSPNILNEGLVAHKGTLTLPIVETSRFAYLAGRLRVQTAPVFFTANYFADKAATQQVGLRELVLDPEIETGAQLRIPNLGPWVRLSFTPETEATEYLLTARLFLTNRVHPLELIPVRPLLLTNFGAFAGKESKVIYLNGYYAGPVRMVVNKENQVLDVLVEAESSIGNWQLVDFRELAGTTTVEALTSLLPETACRITLSSAGAQNYVIRVTPSLTGSS